MLTNRPYVRMTGPLGHGGLKNILLVFGIGDLCNVLEVLILVLMQIVNQRMTFSCSVSWCVFFSIQRPLNALLHLMYALVRMEDG